MYMGADVGKDMGVELVMNVGADVSRGWARKRMLMLLRHGWRWGRCIEIVACV